MRELAVPEPEAPVRLTQEEAQELVLRTVAAEAESLLRTAYRHSLCDDDAHDAYQRSMEIFMRRARTLDPELASRWLHVVVKREAMEVRRGRSELVASEDIDFDRHESPHVSSPEERVLSTDRTTRAAEALRRLKPQELRALWLKALGHSYAEIGEVTGYSATKVNRCLTEGRKSFLERFEGIETGEECRRWQVVLSAMADGEATAAQLTDVRPHLRNCPACRATLRGLHGAQRPLAAVLPVGLVGAGMKVIGLFERLLPGAGDAPTAAGAAGGTGLLGLGGAKLAGLVAAGAVATAGGGLVVAHERHDVAPSPGSTAAHGPPPRVVAARGATPTPTPTPGRAIALSRSSPTSHPVRSKRRTAARRRLAVRRHPTTARLEFAPAGADAPASSAPLAPAALTASAVEPRNTPPSNPMPADTVRGEFAPRP
jgi:RNA polymerase sigma factor (sigma-70 family)